MDCYLSAVDLFLSSGLEYVHPRSMNNGSQDVNERILDQYLMSTNRNRLPSPGYVH